MQDLRFSTVARCLDKQHTIMGFEIPDLAASLLTLVLADFVTGSSLLSWSIAVAVALCLRISKKGKPDGFLLHWVRFHLRPKRLYAGVIPAQSPHMYAIPGRYQL